MSRPHEPGPAEDERPEGAGPGGTGPEGAGPKGAGTEGAGSDRTPRGRPDEAAAWDDIVARLRPEMPDVPAAPAEQTRPPWPVLRSEPVDDDLPGDFVPPEPPPVLSGRPSLVLAACALLLPLLALLLLTVLPVSLPGWAPPALLAVAVAGGVGLFLQLPRRGDGRGDRLDRGAQV